MKDKVCLLSLVLIVTVMSCTKDVGPAQTCTLSAADSTSTNPKGQLYQQVLNKYTQKGLPGIALLIKDSLGRIWTGSSGYADIQKGIKMEACHISKIASVTKIFVASLTLRLVEEGRLQLEAPISQYLPSNIINRIKNADQVTLHQLLSHNSGIYDVITDNGFYLAVLNDPQKQWTQEQLLEYVYGKPAAFAPGQGPGYSNTNTLLVSLILDEVFGDHATLLRNEILNPYDLANTYYYWHEGLPAGIAQGYYDLYNNGSIENLTNYNTGSGNGYGGIYSTVWDMCTYLDILLVQKRFLSPAYVDTMLVFPPKADDGMLLGTGIVKDFINRAPNEYAYGHRGRDLAYSADLFYFPEKHQFLSLIVNYGTNGTSSLLPVFDSLRTEIVDKMMQ